MKRPAFQFYPADWRNNAKLRRCSPAARGAWIDVLCLLHDSDEYGVLRWPLAEIARAAGVPLKLLRELSDKDVLKGADRDAPGYSFAPTHAGKRGNSVILVSQSEGPCWYCTRFVRDEYIRQKRGLSSQFNADNQPPKPQPKPPFGDGKGDGLTSTSSFSSNSYTSMEGKSHLPAAPENVGYFEPPIESPKTAPLPSPAAEAAIALNRIGIGCTSLNPNLIAAVTEGVTTRHLIETAARLPGTGANYVIAAARREHAEKAKPIRTGAPRHEQTHQRKLCVVDRVVANSQAWVDGQRDNDDRVVQTIPRATG